MVPDLGPDFIVFQQIDFAGQKPRSLQPAQSRLRPGRPGEEDLPPVMNETISRRQGAQKAVGAEKAAKDKKAHIGFPPVFYAAAGGIVRILLHPTEKEKRQEDFSFPLFYSVG